MKPFEKLTDATEEENTNLNFVKNNKIYIHGEFDETISLNVIPELHRIVEQQEKKKEGKIVFEICSVGGYLYILNELLSVIEQAKEKGIIVETRAMSIAHSAASMLLMSGTKGHRYASPLSYVLIHHASQGIYSSTDEQLDRAYVKNKHQNAVLKKLIKKYSKIPDKELTKMLTDDCYYLSGENLIKFGIVDNLTFKL